MDSFLQQTNEQFYKFKYLSTTPIFSNIYLTLSYNGEMSLRSSGNGCDIFITLPGKPMNDPAFNSDEVETLDEIMAWNCQVANMLYDKTAGMDIPYIVEIYSAMKKAGFTTDIGVTNYAIASWLQQTCAERLSLL